MPTFLLSSEVATTNWPWGGTSTNIKPTNTTRYMIYESCSFVYLKLWDTMGAWFSYQLQPPAAAALLHSPSWKQHSVTPVILASIARAERSTTHMDVDLRRLPPCNFCRQKSDLVRKIQHHRLQSLYAAVTSNKWWKLFRLAFIICDKTWLDRLAEGVKGDDKK